ncbi:hypothetical protein B0J13DRAFT_289116 [Dactylonectria estremocensis]|uniref:Uncharacterized protein n=1 Tax=Dactylonectria estremocensis TaxID=1079267 RepID=A0A9P9F162_9HYPO|nr:hypothetical protein B0J13DRAFT_289116 [Dactylonectria estremocensis]
MTSRPTVLSPATPSELLSYIISCHRYPTTLIVGSSRQEFLGAVVEDVAQQLSLQEEQTGNHDIRSHPFLKAPLYQVAISRHIRIIFTPTVTHFRTYLSVFSAADSPIQAPPNHVPDRKPPLLLVYGLLAVHRDASEWSAQGIGNSAAVLVDGAARNAFRPVLIEPRGVGGHEDLEHLCKEVIPLLNGTARKDDGSWSGRGVSIKQVLCRWFEFESQEWAAS